jgi:hypothetical protein
LKRRDDTIRFRDPVDIYYKNRYFSAIHIEIITGRSAARLARLLWEQEVAGSNPAAPTTDIKGFAVFGRPFFIFRNTPFHPYFQPSRLIFNNIGVPGRMLD